MSRGDRRIGAVIEHVWRSGGTFQEWSERFDLGLWHEGLERAGLTVDDVVHRHRQPHETLPWDHISAGLHRDFLWQDYLDALGERGLEDCRWTPCYDCGACTDSGVEHVVASNVPLPEGAREPGRTSPRGVVPVRLMPTAPRRQVVPAVATEVVPAGVHDMEAVPVASSRGAM